MGGRVLEYPEKTIRREALAEGLRQGESERKRLEAEIKALREENAKLRAMAGN